MQRNFWPLDKAAAGEMSFLLFLTIYPAKGVGNGSGWVCAGAALGMRGCCLTSCYDNVKGSPILASPAWNQVLQEKLSLLLTASSNVSLAANKGQGSQGGRNQLDQRSRKSDLPFICWFTPLFLGKMQLFTREVDSESSPPAPGAASVLHSHFLLPAPTGAAGGMLGCWDAGSGPGM